MTAQPYPADPGTVRDHLNELRQHGGTYGRCVQNADISALGTMHAAVSAVRTDCPLLRGPVGDGDAHRGR